MAAPNFNLLPTLDALLQEGSVSAAARRVGLSTAAMSHALARLRVEVGDPLLVRAGRRMVLTPRAQELRPKLRELVAAAEGLLAPPRPVALRALERTFVIHATDYVLHVLGLPLDRAVVAEAPGVSLRFVGNRTDDAAELREGGSDLAVGIYGQLPDEMRTRPLLTDRFVCVVRRAHPLVGARLSLAQFTELAHVQVAPRGLPGGYIDDVLRARGLARRVARAIPSFLAALHIVSGTDYLLTISARIAASLAPKFDLRVLEPPLPLRPYTLSLVWHSRFDADPAHRWLRRTFARVAAEVAPGDHEGARRRLDPSDPASGQRRKRIRRK